VNSKFGGFEIQIGPIPPVFTKFQKNQPIFLTLPPTRPDSCNGCAAHVRERKKKEQLRGVVVGVAFALARSSNGAVTSRLTGKSKKAEAPAQRMGGPVGSNKHADEFVWASQNE
jgi:hypothetical protein